MINKGIVDDKGTQIIKKYRRETKQGYLTDFFRENII